MRKRHILVTDDHNLFRKSLIGMIRTFNRRYTFTEASNGFEALEALEKNEIDLMLMDIQMPGMDGVELLKKIRQKNIPVRIIVLSQFEERVLIGHVMGLGASGYLNKTCGPEELNSALRTVLAGDVYQSEETIESLRLALEPDQANLNLSARERQMLKLLKEGKSNKEIADLQHLTLNTVESYRKALLKKTKCKNVTELISLAYRTGLS